MANRKKQPELLRNCWIFLAIYLTIHLFVLADLWLIAGISLTALATLVVAASLSEELRNKHLKGIAASIGFDNNVRFAVVGIVMVISWIVVCKYGLGESPAVEAIHGARNAVVANYNDSSLLQGAKNFFLDGKFKSDPEMGKALSQIVIYESKSWIPTWIAVLNSILFICYLTAFRDELGQILKEGAAWIREQRKLVKAATTVATTTAAAVAGAPSQSKKFGWLFGTSFLADIFARLLELLGSKIAGLR